MPHAQDTQHAQHAQPDAPVFPALYPNAPPFRSHALPVTGGHVLHIEESGNAFGLPALLLHGGPGSGSSPLLRRFFDPARYRVISVDQRGAGASQPRGQTAHNTTADLLADLRALREHLRIDRWLVVGGSWGAALAIAHAADAPRAVSGLLLRAVFLARAEDTAWFFQGARRLNPDAWEQFAALAPVARRDDLPGFLAEAFAEGDELTCTALARAWWNWEQALSGSNGRETAALLPARPLTPPSPQQGDGAIQLAALVDRYRIQAHYLSHHCWLTDPPLLARCARLPAAPTLLLHGREDQVCRPDAALAAAAHIAGSRLRWVEGAGHDPSHPAMAGASIAALDRFAAHGDFDQRLTP